MQVPELSSDLLNLVHAMGLARDLDGVLEALLHSASQLVRSDGCAVLLVAGDYIKVLSSKGLTAPLPGLVLPTSQMGAARLVIEGGRCLRISDTAADRQWQRVPGEERARSWLGLPLEYAERAVGLVEWTAREPRRFSDSDISVGGQIAQYAAPALYGATLLHEMRRRLSGLAEQAERPWSPRGPATPSDFGALLSPLVAEAQEATRARHAFAFVLDESTGLMQCAAARGDRDRLMEMRLLGDGTVGGWAVAPGRVRKGKHPSDREVLSGLRCNALQVLPLRVRGEVVGMMGVADSTPSQSFPSDAIRMMTHLASQASLLLDRSFQAKSDSVSYDFEAVVQSAPLGIGALSLRGDVLYCNAGMADLLSRSSLTLVGRNLAEFLVAGDRGRLGHTLEEVAVTRQRLQVDVRLRGSVSEQRHLRLWLASRHAPGEDGQSLILIAEDITALKILEQERVDHLRELREKNAQLSELDQLKSRFVANVSHELRTPLAVIKLYAALARKGRPEKRDHYLQTIEHETHRLETIVENVLDLSRMDRQVLQVHPELLDVRLVLAQVAEIYAESAKRQGIDLVNEVTGPVALIFADKNHLVQMLTNLIDNAVRYAPRGGRIWLGAGIVSLEGKRVVEIRVSDTGPGIPDDEQDKVFERFYRGRNNPEPTGTGLGLAIVRELAAQNHGMVVLRSRVGEGSTFALQFPAQEQPGVSGSEQTGLHQLSREQETA